MSDSLLYVSADGDNASYTFTERKEGRKVFPMDDNPLRSIEVL